MEKKIDFVKVLQPFLEKKEPIIEGQEPENDISFQWVKKNKELTLIEEGIPINEFDEHIKKRNLDMEFRLIRRLTESQHHSNALTDFHPNMNKLNRYSNILPYKSSMVKVDSASISDEYASYINANFINTSMGDKKKCIATQGPLPNTTQNFWKMAQCDQYWPKDKEKFSEYFEKDSGKKLKVTLANKIKNDNFNTVEREILLEMFNEDTLIGKKTVSHIQWKGWPDHGVPDEKDDQVVKMLVERMMEIYCKEDEKIAVHCSAGIGRTGTLISIFDLSLVFYKYLNQIQKDKKFDKTQRISVFGCVRRIREQRWGMDQYGYVYKFMTNVMKSHLENKLE